jgi:hypothetical protein
MQPETRVIRGERSWVVQSDRVELAVTERGAHMAPVTFDRAAGRPIQPYYISPWQGDGVAVPAPVLAPLRGDFFCLPFGGNAAPSRGERHPPHGETAGSPWMLRGAGREGAVTRLDLSCETTARRGRVTRQFRLVDGENAVYCATRIENFAGPAPFGHHAILDASGGEGSLRISTSPFRLGLTCPHPFSVPANGEYQSLAAGAEFADLARVPTQFVNPDTTDCSAFPARTGYADLVGLHEDPVPGAASWVTVVNGAAGWLWFALKDPSVMPARLLWMENRGRHGAPWAGRNCCLGIEDGCMYFDLGLAESATENLLTRRGFPTCRVLDGRTPFEVRYIQGALRVPPGFSRVVAARLEPNRVLFVDGAGTVARTAVRTTFLGSGALA